jgi:hypothetical protein
MNAIEMMKFVSPHTATEIFNYRGIECQQHRNVLLALDVLNSVLEETPRTIVELGTMWGSFTRILADHDISARATIETWDHTSNCKQDLDAKVTKRFGNVFDATNASSIAATIGQPGLSVLFCDNGDKVREVRMFTPALKPGDIILCHDYMREPSMAGTEQVGGWRGCEVTWAKVKDAVEGAGCAPFLEKAFQHAVWGCFRRAV